MKSIRTKILIMVGGAAIIAMLISGILTVNMAYRTVLKDKSVSSKLEADLITKEIDQFFLQHLTTVRSLSVNPDVIRFLKKADSRDTFKTLPEYTTVYQTLNNIMDLNQSDILSLFVASSSKDIAFDGNVWTADAGYDIKTRDFWITDEDKKVGYKITEPYQDVATGNMVVTIAAPVYEDKNHNTIIGVTAVDITIDRLSTIVMERNKQYDDTDSEILMVSGDNLILASGTEESDNSGEDTKELDISDGIIQELFHSNENETLKLKPKNKPSYGAVSSAKLLHWKVALIISENDFLAEAKQAGMSITIMYIIVILILIVILIIAANGISAPVRRLTLLTRRLAAGELSTDINVNGNDEIGELAESMRMLVGRLHTYIDYINEISFALDRFSDGFLNIELKHTYDGEFAKIKISLEKVSSVFEDTIGKITDASSNVTNGSVEMANTAQMLAERTSRQADLTKSLTTTVNNLSAQVSENAIHAMNAAEQGKDVGEKADRSSIRMNEMMEAIRQINDKSSEISKIIKVIEDIAFQTNILALNAAVEAARAGEAGKGFAVVADEVRNLAGKSSQAAKDTTALIEETIKTVENGTQIADRTGEILSEVISGVEQIVNLINEISSASAGQADALKQTLQGVDRISIDVQENAGAAQESFSASKELSEQAHNLEKIAAMFHTDNEQ